jgi:hypothetical protein
MSRLLGDDHEINFTGFPGLEQHRDLLRVARAPLTSPTDVGGNASPPSFLGIHEQVSVSFD